MKLKYDTLKFMPLTKVVRCIFHKNFYFDIPKSQLDELGTWSIDTEQALEILDENASTLDRLIQQGIQHLTSMVTGNPTIFIDEKSGIPLIGNPGFGIVDRGTNIIEVKPVTGCNLACVYCSLSEGTDIKEYDYLIDADYLVQELGKVLEEKDLLKEDDQVEIHISVHGEPFIYGDMPYLCKNIRSHYPSVCSITVDTNGLLLTEEYIDALAEAGMTRINMSLDSLDAKRARKIAGDRPYSVKRLLELIGYMSKHPKMDCLVAPVWMQQYNDDDIRHIVRYGKEHDILLGIQNYMNYKGGQFLGENLSWEEFRKRLEKIQNEEGYQLVLDFYKDFSVRKVPAIKKPFKKRQIVDAVIKAHGRHAKQMIGVSQNRNIILFGKDIEAKKMGQKVRAKITRDKHNIFYAEVM